MFLLQCKHNFYTTEIFSNRFVSHFACADTRLINFVNKTIEHAARSSHTDEMTARRNGQKQREGSKRLTMSISSETVWNDRQNEARTDEIN